MNHINSHFIQALFDEVIAFRPQLKAAVIVDDEFEETADVRLLGDVLIRAFPWPIGVEMRRLFSGSCRNLDKFRLDQILKTAERTVHFTGLSLFVEVLRLHENKIIELPEPFVRQLNHRFFTLSFGDLVWLLCECTKLCVEAGGACFLQEVAARMNAKLQKMLNEWVADRNQLAHHQVNLTEDAIQKRCIEGLEALTQLMVALAPLTKYRLVSVREIRVENTKGNPPVFDHLLNLLNSVDSDFKSTSIKNNWFTESDSVLLVKSMKDQGQFISLSPFVIDTHGETIDQRDKFNLKKDVFLYSKFRNGHLMYVGTEVTETCDLRVLQSYDRLSSEFNLLLEPFTSAAS